MRGAEAASELNAFQMGGRALTVNEARPKPEGGFGGGGGGFGRHRAAAVAGRTPRAALCSAPSDTIEAR